MAGAVMSMTERRILTFVETGGHYHAYMGTHLVGAVRERHGVEQTGEWIFYLCETHHGQRVHNWRGARDIDAAKEALLRYAADWYDAAHTPLAPGQGERLARHARVG